MGCCVRGVSKKMSDILPVGGGCGGPMLGGTWVPRERGGGAVAEIVPKSNVPPPPY